MRQVIVLERLRIGNPPSFRFAMWAAVPAGRESAYAQDSNWQSQFSGATAGELSALRAGTVVERVERFDATLNLTIGQIETELQNRWTAFQASVTGDNYWDRFGSSWDGASWTLIGLA